MRELLSHKANVHARQKVSCKHCDYHTVSKAKMHQHVRLHTTGMKCMHCGKRFPSLSAMLAHKKLHAKDRPVFDCMHCDNSYKTAGALQTHVTGKHGSGFLCANCDKRFDTPAQCVRYFWKCM